MNRFIRINCLLVLLISLQHTYGQGRGVDPEYEARLMRFGTVRIDSFWSYHANDDTTFANPAFNDRRWHKVYPKTFKDSAGRPITWRGIGWFRQRLLVPDSLRGRQLAMLMGQFGASQVYIDGTPVYEFGQVGLDAKNEEIYIPRKPVILTLDSQAVHLVAVRFSSHIPVQVTPLVQFPGFHLSIAPLPQALKEMNEGFPYKVVSACFMIGFCLFFFCVYLFYPFRTASLMAALQLADFAVLFIVIVVAKVTTSERVLVHALFTYTVFETILGCLGLLFLYSAYYGKLIKRAWLVAAILVLFILDVFYPSGLSPVLSLLNVFIVFEAVRMLYLGLKHKKSGFLILTIGYVIIALGAQLVFFNRFNLFPSYATTLTSVLAVITDLCIPLTYALHLAWEFGSANRDLRLQLQHVNELSEKTLKQEQEKQQILSNQKEMLEHQVTQRTVELKQSLEELKATQKQLVQREKMASLGELTAGIAHEIQNPLNFVNNFSDVNAELLDELKDELLSDNKKEAISIIDDIKENEQKINHHGKRADAIVKGMLEHSRASTGKKEPTDINALADEYLRLSYHGLRAKVKDFNAIIETSFDESIGMIDVVPQDIGRVLLNLFNNAFYAVNDKKKAKDLEGFQNLQGLNIYEPTVTVSTKKLNDKLEVRVKDNGTGIPQKVVDKIFQPFFTTKPTGQGTGLGLSLSYDIIKAHGGDIKVKSKEGEGAEFIIELQV